MILKVCGMRDQENIRQVAALAPDMMGFIFYKDSPRDVTGVLDPKVLHSLAPGIKKVAVFVNPTFEEVMEITRRYGFDFIQLHGEESRAFIERLHVLETGIIKVVPGNHALNRAYMEELEPYIDYWLLDTRTDKHGGTGKSFDRAVLETYPFKKPVLLSGGLDKDRINEIKSEGHLSVVGVDVNSRVEDAPGLKNIAKVKEVTECLK